MLLEKIVALGTCLFNDQQLKFVKPKVLVVHVYQQSKRVSTFPTSFPLCLSADSPTMTSGVLPNISHPTIMAEVGNGH